MISPFLCPSYFPYVSCSVQACFFIIDIEAMPGLMPGRFIFITTFVSFVLNIIYMSIQCLHTRLLEMDGVCAYACTEKNCVFVLMSTWLCKLMHATWSLSVSLC